MTATAPEALRRGRELVGPRLQAAVSRLGPRLALIAGYQLGWLEADGRPAAGDGGKSLRATLALLSARATGSDADAGVPAAVAVELVHNFSLLHDDVMDRDLTRRHRPTAWTVFGVADALLAGDALLALAVQVLLESDAPDPARAALMLADATCRLVDGQADDLAFEGRGDVGVVECLEMAAGKTGALLACAASIGAAMLGAPAEVTSGLHRYGAHLGLAFQLVDDLLGIWGDPEVTGKPVRSDLRSGKKSVPVTAALAGGGPAAAELADLLGSEEDAQLARAARIIEAVGARRWTELEAERQLAAACVALDGILLPDAVRAELAALAEFTGRRSS